MAWICLGDREFFVKYHYARAHLRHTMHEGKPLLTVVKSRIIDEPKPPLMPQDEGLLQTLSMLCSFQTTEDLASFLFSPMFQHLTSNRPPFVVFEIGVYLDHTKTLELIASEQGVIFADVHASGAFENNIHSVEDEVDANAQLMHWHATVYDEKQRFV
jgi:hypothetical protein